MQKRINSKISYNWTTDEKGNECLMRGLLPLFEIRPEGRYFRIYYYGTCGIHVCKTVDEAKAYINRKMEGYV